MKKTILFTVMTAMSLASMAGDISVLRFDPSTTPGVVSYDRALGGDAGHVRVYNLAKSPGFVITRGDEVVGYSTEGAFSRATAAPALLDLLDAMTAADESESGAFTPVAPLRNEKGYVMWNQDSPYNDLCPLYDLTNRCPSGCVATAMAQVMFYHQWPPQGTGEHTYSPAVLAGNTLSADFGNTVYNWDAMLPVYTADSPAASREAVAELMLHCGVAVDMFYYTQSGATDYDVPPALVNYFRYDEGLAYRKREHYSTADWLGIINSELLAGRMVLAYGKASSGGHAFVFDGMDERGFIHVNWGWGGMSNGYFATSALTPASQGIGGSDGGFNYSQRIITGIKPAIEGATSDRHVELTSSEGLAAGRKKIQQGADVTMKLSGKVTNHGWQASTFDYALMLTDAEGNTVKIVEGPKGVTLDKDVSTYAPDFGTVNFGTLAPGEYTLRPACRDAEATGEWIPIRDDYTGYPNYLRITATDSEITFAAPDYFDLQATSVEAPAIIYSGVPTLITATVVNNGDVAYHGEVKAALRNGNANVATTTNYIIDPAPGESTDIRFTDAFNAPAGQYRLVLIDDDGRVISAPRDIAVIDAPAEGVVSSTSEVAVEANSKELMTVKATLKVSGGEFHGLLYAFIYNPEGTRQHGCLFPEYLSIADGEETQLTVSGTFENGVPGTTYRIRLATYNGLSYHFLDDDQSTVLFTFMTPDGIGDIEADDNSQYIYFDVLGRQVNPRMSKTYKKLRIKK